MWTLSDAIVDRDRAGCRGRGGAPLRPGRVRDAARLPDGKAPPRGSPCAGGPGGRAQPARARSIAPHAPIRGQAASSPRQGRDLNLASRLHVRGRRPRVVDPRRFRLPRGGRAGARRGESHARRRLRAGEGPTRRRRRARERREPSCGRRCSGEGRPSARPCRSSRRACGARRQRSRNRPAATAASRRLKCVFTAPEKNGGSRSARGWSGRCACVVKRYWP